MVVLALAAERLRRRLFEHSQDAPRSLGSRLSRSESPMMVSVSTVAEMARVGHIPGCGFGGMDGDAGVYEHPERPEAKIILPAVPVGDGVLDYHLLAVRTTLDLNGIADPTDFAAKLKKAS